MKGPVEPDTGHRVLPHTADVIVEAWAPNRAGCLEELVRGVVDTFADVGTVTATREIPLEVGAARDEDVVVAIFDDVCYLLDADGLVVVDVALEEEEDGNFDGIFFVAPVDAVVPTGAPPKGISRSDLQFGPDGNRWRARAIVDV
jgi:SHS2 domain-containing protein